MTKDSQSPVALALEQVASLRAEADRLERTTLLDAFAAAKGSELGAAKLLEITRDKLHALIRRRYPDIADAARAMRIANGGPLDGGNPRLRPRLQVGAGKSP